MAQRAEWTANGIVDGRLAEEETMTVKHDIEHVIGRMEEALELQRTEEGEIATKPTVGYCLECDEIVVDDWFPDGCGDHQTLSSDGYEHGGIQSALTALRYISTDTNSEVKAGE